MSETIKAELIEAGTIKGKTTITYEVSIEDLKKFKLTFYRPVMLTIAEIEEGAKE